MTSTIPGVDYPWAHPGGAALKTAGKALAAPMHSWLATKGL